MRMRRIQFRQPITKNPDRPRETGETAFHGSPGIIKCVLERAAVALGLVLAVVTPSKTLAQLAVDVVHGYPLQGYATYTAGQAGHTGQAGDSAISLGSSGSTFLSVNDPGFLAALNAAAANDTLSVSVWAQLDAISAASVFWFWSPSSPSTERGFQAHLPWSDDTIYFDTAGCCDAGVTRISAKINTFPGYTGDDTWWNSWHHFVFLKNGSSKQVWVDGVLFLDGTGSAPLPADFNLLSVGSGLPALNSLNGRIDDFAVFGSGLSSNDVHLLFTGTAPTALTGDNLLAFWNFNISKTLFVPIQAGPGATGVSPDISAYYVIANGATSVQLNSIKLSVNGADVTSAATIVPDAVLPIIAGSTAGATVYYSTPTPFPPNSVQNITLVYSDTSANVYSNTYPVTVESYNGFVTDSHGGHLGFLEGTAFFTSDGSGHTGKPGDRAIDLESVAGGGDVHVGLANFLDQATTNNTLSVSMWMKLHAVASGGAVFARSPSSSGTERGFAALLWSDDNIYFDTAGCCDQALQRVIAPINTFPSYVNDGFWTNWHHYVFLYNATDKQIWIDGTQLADGVSGTPLPTDFRDLFFGFDSADGAYQQAIIDDVSVFATPLTPTSIVELATNNAAPSSLAGETLLAYWDFNSLSPGPPFVAASSVPVPGSTNALPDVGANILIVNRSTQVQTNSIRLSVNGVDVTSAATITPNSVGASIAYISSTLLPPGSANTITVSFADDGTPVTRITNTWSFGVERYNAYAYSRDAVHGYLAMFLGNTGFTPDGGGHTGVHGDRAIDLGVNNGGGATVLDPPFLTALNTALGKDKLSVSFWLKQAQISSSSAFWFHSPSVDRDFQAHVPWSDDNIYFDTAGCCDGTSQRVSKNINTFSGWASDAFWNGWHNFVFLKDGTNKQVWIDGQIFLAGTSTAPLTTDINELFIGTSGGGGPIGQMDDFAVFGDALSGTQIAGIFGGTAPTALGNTNLLAFWGFEDVGPAFIASRTPVPNALGVAASGPASHVVVVLVDGSTAVQTSTVLLKFNGADVTAASTINTSSNGVTQIQFAPPPQPSRSSNVVTVVFSDNGTPPNLTSNTWSYVTEAYTFVTKDVLHAYPALLHPSAVFTASGGGHSGTAGDYAIDLTRTGGPIHVDDASFLYPAETNDTMTFSFWMKKYDIAGSSAFWVNSPSSAGGRGFQAHVPWSDDTIYYDTGDAGANRISASITSFPGFTDDGFWTNSWHHFAFVFNASDKTVWIDGQMFTEGVNPGALPLDFTDLYLGSEGTGTANINHGLMDDFAAFASAVDPTNIALLATGTVPTALKNERLLAYWSFNDPPASSGPASINIGVTGGQIKITYTGTLQSSATVNGTYQDVSGATSPYTVDTSKGPQVFYRTHQ